MLPRAVAGWSLRSGDRLLRRRTRCLQHAVVLLLSNPIAFARACVGCRWSSNPSWRSPAPRYGLRPVSWISIPPGESSTPGPMSHDVPTCSRPVGWAITRTGCLSSLRRRVADALRDVRPDWRRRGRRRCRTAALWKQNRPDCIVPLHGAAGEDGALRDLLETLDIDYVGSDASGSRVAFDKPVASTLVSGTGVAVPELSSCRNRHSESLGAPAVMAAIGDRIGFPSWSSHAWW